MLLQVEGLIKVFGGLTAINNLDFHIENREILGLIGPNGSGKTTVFNLITGVHKPTQGKVFFDGKDMTGLKPHRVTAAGVARTFQLAKLFCESSVLEHVIVGQHCRTRAGVWSALTQNSSSQREEEESQRKAIELLKFTNLFSVKDEYAGNLSCAQQRRLMIATAMASDPKLILLDEPTSGMSAEEVAEVVEIIRNIRDGGVTVFLIEHNMRVAMNICDRIAVLNYGKKIAEGTPEEVAHNKSVIDAYLGDE